MSEGETFQLLHDEGATRKPIPWLAIFVALIACGVCFGIGVLSGSFIHRPVVINGLCTPPENGPEIPKNVIIVIGDGNGPTSVSLTRLMKGAPLVVDNNNMLAGTVLTRAADSIITDSAAAATAYACGKKTNNGWVAVDPVTQTPIGTIFEAAKDLGYSIGVVTTAEVTDATPASFTAHSLSRKFEEFIASQQVYQNIDILLGGGLNWFPPPVLQVPLDQGYTFVQTRDELLNTTSLPVLGLFAPEFIAFSLDRELTSQPSLVDMTQQALTLLEAQDNPKGFLLMVEESSIDVTQHIWDAGSSYRAGLSLDATNQVIMDFAIRRNDTLVLITADHECGGIAMGLNGIKYYYPQYLVDQKRSTLFMAQAMANTTDSEVILAIIQNYTGIVPNATEIDSIIPIFDDWDRARLIGKIVSDRALTGWSTSQHTAADVTLYGYGPGVQNFCGTIDNTDLGNRIISMLGLDVNAVTERIKNNPVSPP